MSDKKSPRSSFDIPDVPRWVPRRVKPWIFIFFVLIVQFSSGFYPAAAADMMGTTAVMQQDIQMAGFAMLVGMSLNFCVMFRLKFRFSNRVSLLICTLALLAANIICGHTSSVPVLVAACFLSGWFRMWATFACNSTIQIWVTPKRDMAIWFCYIYLIVDTVIQLSGVAAIYTAFFLQWKYMQLAISGVLVLMLVMILVLIKPVKGSMQLPLLGIDWIGAGLWGIVMLTFTFVCVYGNYYDWWDAPEIRGATLLGLVCMGINLWRATFLRHPYISYTTLTNRNVVRSVPVYIVLYILVATEHVFEHSYAATILGFDKTNLIDLNWYALIGILTGCAFTFFTFARLHWRYKTMTLIGFGLTAVYLAYFYFFIDYGVEKEALFFPLFCRGFGTVIIAIILLTSLTPEESGLHFFIFPQSLAINGFCCAVMSGTLGPAILGEWLNRAMARNASLLGAWLTDTNPAATHTPLEQLYSMVQQQALVVSMKEIYGWLLIGALFILMVIAVSYSPWRPSAIVPKWRNIRKIFARQTKEIQREHVM